MATGYVISDLHMFARWSKPGKYIEQMNDAAAVADFFVLNGDIFDFRWSILPNTQATINAAVDWLTQLASDHPNCTVYYILGNHDGFAGMARRLTELAAQIENFEWRPAYLRMGDTLFAHGDLFWRAGGDPFERRLPTTLRRISPLLGWVYHLVHTAQVTRIVHAFCPASRCARQIVKSLGYGPDKRTRGIANVYCGHTHVPVYNFSHKNITFHNTGSGIKGLRCNMCNVSIPDDCEISR
jgi:UDP-2,3-diacylglucosamine pyrophosphatase LpxH